MFLRELFVLNPDNDREINGRDKEHLMYAVDNLWDSSKFSAKHKCIIESNVLPKMLRLLRGSV